QERLGDYQAQAEALQRVLAIDPAHLAARLALGNSFIGEGRWEEAIKEYSVAATSPYAPLGVFTMLGRLRIARARAGESNADEWRDIDGFVGRLCERFRHSAEPVLLMAESLAARHEFDRAARLLREETGKKMHDPRLWVALASVTEQSEGLRAALQVLD